MNWIRVYDNLGLTVENLNGLDWYKAKPPFRFHKHKAQTRWWSGVEYTERCACGAFGPKPFILLYPDKPRRKKWLKVLGL